MARGIDLKELDMALQNALSARIRPERTTGETKILNPNRRELPTCECPERCETELNVISPARGWDDWDSIVPTRQSFACLLRCRCSRRLARIISRPQQIEEEEDLR